MPEIENWICKVATEINLNLEIEHSLPNTPNELGKITKTETSNYDVKFINLFKSMLNKSKQINFAPVLKLQSWLCKLAHDKLDVNINELIQ